MLRVVLSFLMVVWSVSVCLPVWSAGAEDSQVDENRGFKSRDERIGGLRLDQPEKELAAVIACKPKKSGELLEEATGLYVQTWKYSDCGIVLKMGAERKGRAKVVENVTVTAPADLATSRGIRIGSTEAEVAGAYGAFEDQESSEKGKTFVAGSVYDGMIFHFKNGKVTKIFLGASAE